MLVTKTRFQTFVTRRAAPFGVRGRPSAGLWSAQASTDTSKLDRALACIRARLRTPARAKRGRGRERAASSPFPRCPRSSVCDVVPFSPSPPITPSLNLRLQSSTLRLLVALLLADRVEDGLQIHRQRRFELE